MAGADATVVIVIERAKKRLKEVGALTPESAKTAKELGLEELWLKAGARAGVTATHDGRYYLRSK